MQVSRERNPHNYLFAGRAGRRRCQMLIGTAKVPRIRASATLPMLLSRR
jgi:hypothetical protein